MDQQPSLESLWKSLACSILADKATRVVRHSQVCDSEFSLPGNSASSLHLYTLVDNTHLLLINPALFRIFTAVSSMNGLV